MKKKNREKRNLIIAIAAAALIIIAITLGAIAANSKKNDTPSTSSDVTQDMIDDFIKEAQEAEGK